LRHVASDDAPVAEENVPPGHKVHSALPVKLAYRPAGHDRHAVLPAWF
jgi:hypothetical protein